MQPNGIIFWDWNGTLLDDVDFTHGCLNWMLENHGYPQRYDLAQYREMEVFTQFSSDLDEETKNQLAYGQSLMYILRQGRCSPLSQAQQIVTLVTAMARVYQQVPVSQVCPLRDFILGEFAAGRPQLMQELEQGAALTDEVRQQIVDFAKTALEKFRRAGGR